MRRRILDTFRTAGGRQKASGRTGVATLALSLGHAVFEFEEYKEQLTDEEFKRRLHAVAEFIQQHPERVLEARHGPPELVHIRWDEESDFWQ